LGGGAFRRVRSYGINEYNAPVDGIALANDVGGQEVYWKLSDHRRLAPVNCWVFGDEHEDSINDGKFEVNYAPTGWDELPAARHNRRGAFSFADGHVETHRWVDPRTLVPSSRAKNGQIVAASQADSPDVHWLFERSTAYLKK
jgi:prepilin-type processing-associated H-X9-DG protein